MSQTSDRPLLADGIADTKPFLFDVLRDIADKLQREIGEDMVEVKCEMATHDNGRISFHTNMERTDTGPYSGYGMAKLPSIEVYRVDIYGTKGDASLHDGLSHTNLQILTEVALRAKIAELFKSDRIQSKITQYLSI